MVPHVCIGMYPRVGGEPTRKLTRSVIFFSPKVWVSFGRFFGVFIQTICQVGVIRAENKEIKTDPKKSESVSVFGRRNQTKKKEK